MKILRYLEINISENDIVNLAMCSHNLRLFKTEDENEKSIQVKTIIYDKFMSFIKK